MKKTFAPLAALALLSFVTLDVAPAFAADSDRTVPPSIQRSHDRRQVEIKPYDLNKDGILDKKEQEASLAGKFKLLDKNKDGKVSPEEIEGAGEAYSASRVKREGEPNPVILNREVVKLEKRLNEADANGDGIVSQTEYTAFQKARLLRMDKDGDGKISLKEYRLDGEEWSKNKKNNCRDTDHDGDNDKSSC
jgi:Ca2+-binding EF-hand superfamily protein